MLRTLVPSLALCAAACSSTPPAVQCEAPRTVCSGSCVDLAANDANCGACGEACAVTETCAGSLCLPTDCPGADCAEWQVCSAAICIDRACVGVICPAAESCARGMCLPKACANQTCGVGELCLDSQCVEAACIGVICPAGATCFAGRCELDTCGNGFQDGAETGPDCGGHCAACGDGKGCIEPTDCQSRVCTAGRCTPGACADSVRNGDEADIDCGGACPLCANGARCTAAGQCQSRVCTAGTCAAPTCTDTVKNGLETDLDCGGQCGTCADGRACSLSSDCASNQCIGMKCVPAICLNGIKDTGETDVDCGGMCAGCATGRMCNVGPDCASGVCGGARTCLPPNCADMVKNGNETDIDCGGSCTAKCGSSRGCVMASDCASLVCSGNRCANATCTDQVLNGTETDLDCGGGNCPGCAAGKICALNRDCVSQVCTMQQCSTVPFFAPPLSYPVGSVPYDLAVGLLDSDGYVDVAVSNRNSYDLTLYFGQDGGFSAPATLGTTNEPNWHGPCAIAMGDLTGDGRNEVVLARFHSDFNFGEHLDYCRLVTYENLGNRVFGVGREHDQLSGEGSSSACGNRLATGDFDSDGLADVVVSDTYRYDCPGNCNNCPGGCSNGGERAGGFFWRSAPGGAFATPVRLPGLGSNFVVTDLNRDGTPDLVGRNFRTPSIAPFISDAGTPQPLTPFAANNGYGDVVAGLFDADQEIDLAWASRETNEVAVSKGLGNGMFVGAVNHAVTGAATLALADLDRDGRLDLLIGTGAGIAVMRGNGDGGFQLPEPNAASLGAVGPLRIADFNGDGKADVATLAQGRLQVLLNATP